jgi:hypothetical protein
MTTTLDTYGPTLASMPVRDALLAYVTGGVAWGRPVPGLASLFARGELRPDLDLAATTRIIHALTIAVGDVQRSLT